MTLPELIHKLWDACAELLYPRSCFGCGARGPYICERCRTAMRPQSYRLNNGMAIFAAFPYHHAGIRRAIKQLKYRGSRDIAASLARIIAASLPADVKTSGAEIVAIPATAHRERARGFNQSKLLGQALAQHLNCAFTDALIKIRETPPQSPLMRAERLKNLQSAFATRETYAPRPSEARPVASEGGPLPAVIIVDDVSTTGATLLEAARVLKIAGATKIIGAVVAH